MCFIIWCIFLGLLGLFIVFIQIAQVWWQKQEQFIRNKIHEYSCSKCGNSLSLSSVILAKENERKMREHSHAVAKEHAIKTGEVMKIRFRIPPDCVCEKCGQELTITLQKKQLIIKPYIMH